MDRQNHSTGLNGWKRPTENESAAELAIGTVLSFVVFVAGSAVLSVAVGVYVVRIFDHSSDDGGESAARCLTTMRFLVPVFLLGLLSSAASANTRVSRAGRRAARAAMVLNIVAVILTNVIPIAAWLCQ